MKKLMIAALMMLSASGAFAKDSEPLKAVLDAKSYTEAVQLLKQNLNQLANAGEKAKAYEHVTKLALKTFDEQNAIQTANIQAQLTKQKIQPLDSVAFFESAYNALVNGMECVKYDAMPNEKGKVKPKYTKSLTPLLTNARIALVGAGNYYAGKGKQEGVLKYWGAFLDTDNDPLFAEAKKSETQYIGQVAYYTALYANQAKQFDRAEKYADIAMQDTAMRKQAETFKYAMAQMNLKNNADSVAFAQKMKAEYEKDPKNETVFGLLCNMYNGLGKTAELEQLVDQKLAVDANNYTALATKARLALDRESKKKTPNYDEAISLFKRAHQANQKNSAVLTFLGFSLNAKAQLLNDKAQQKALYTESMGYLEQAKQMDPDRRESNWSYPLLQCYYSLYGSADARTKVMEAVVKNN